MTHHGVMLTEDHALPPRGPVILADDDHELRAALAFALRRDGYEVLEASDGAELWALLVAELRDEYVRRPGVVISDIRMPGATGLQILAALRAHNQSIPVVLTTAFGSAEIHDESDRLGAQLLLDKPIDLSDLRTVVRVLLGP